MTMPGEGATLPRGHHLLRGLAWSGGAPVSRVEVSVDDGSTWEVASFTSEPVRYAWRSWEYQWLASVPGPVVLQSRERPASGGSVESLRVRESCHPASSSHDQLIVFDFSRS